jgi:hypothetical protein
MGILHLLRQTVAALAQLPPLRALTMLLWCGK